MVTSRTFLGHVVYVKGIKVEKAKIEVISKLPQQKSKRAIIFKTCMIL